MPLKSPSQINSLAQAKQAYERLRPFLSPASSEAIAHRLAHWQKQMSRRKSTSVSLPELVMRPGLPPRPLNKHYFTVIRSL